MSDNPTAPIIIVGAGGHAKVVAEALSLAGRNILGFTTPDIDPGTEISGSSVLGDDSLIRKYSPGEVVLANGIGALPDQDLRWRLAEQLRKDGYEFTQVIHPSVVIAGDVKMAEGVQVMAGAVIQPGTQIGRDSIINTGVMLDHDCNISMNCHLAPGVVCSGGVHVDMGVHLGAGAIVIQNIAIGNFSVVAAGSVVYKDVPSNHKLVQSRFPRVKTDTR